MSRTDASTALAKVFAYLACGKITEARQWAHQLIAFLEGI